MLMNASLDGWPFAGHVSKNYPYPKRPPQWVRIDSLSFEGFITGFQAKRPIDDKSEQGTSKAYNRFRDIIKNGIRFGAGFLEIYEKDIDDKNLEDLIAAGSILLKGKCKCEQR
ncbi:hypothetical protein L0337_25050 [candidate division KSB1 bacterium]|nr:hypothetical protein [candidate division KSB1 bacterium]